MSNVMPDANWKWLDEIAADVRTGTRIFTKRRAEMLLNCIRELRAALEDTLGFYHADTSHGHCERIRALLAKWAKGGDRE